MEADDTGLAAGGTISGCRSWGVAATLSAPLARVAVKDLQRREARALVVSLGRRAVDRQRCLTLVPRLQ